MRLTAAAILAVWGGWLCGGVAPAAADVFVLTNGSRVTGEWVNRRETSPKQYVVQLADGAQVTLDAAQVRQVVHPRPEEAEYEQIRPTYPDTAEGQWALAQWCGEHRLNSQRARHLQRVIELAPDHAEARQALGYRQVDGQWVTHNEIMTQRGLQLFKGQWRSAQEIDILKQKDALKDAQQKWFQDIKVWRAWLGTAREEQARKGFDGIRDPAAAKALTVGLEREPAPAVRLLYLETLARIDSEESAETLAKASLHDPVEEVRLTCLDYLQKKPRPKVVAYYLKELKKRNPDPVMVNRIGVALGRMKDPSAIRPLINALVTSRRVRLVTPGGEGNTSASFSKGPTGSGVSLSAGGGPKYKLEISSNQLVLDALTAMTGHNFGFDVPTWLRWYAMQKKTEPVELRRR